MNATDRPLWREGVDLIAGEFFVFAFVFAMGWLMGFATRHIALFCALVFTLQVPPWALGLYLRRTGKIERYVTTPAAWLQPGGAERRLAEPVPVPPAGLPRYAVLAIRALEVALLAGVAFWAVTRWGAVPVFFPILALLVFPIAGGLEGIVRVIVRRSARAHAPTPARTPAARRAPPAAQR